MQQVLMKVCGMREPHNIAQVAALVPDYMGFIFSKQSPRYVGKDFDPAHLNLLEPATKACGVFVSEYIPTLIDRVEFFHLDAVQLHGNESPEYCKKLRGKLDPIQLIKGIHVGESVDFQALSAYTGVVDLFLFDTKGKSPGGNGIVFDWHMLKAYPLETPFFLSGGIGPDSTDAVREFMSQVPACCGVDVNSRFESAPAEKKASELEQFIKALRQ